MKKIIENYADKPKGLFKRIFITFFFGYLPFAVLHSILNVLGIMPVNFNDENVYGVKGVAIIICFSPLIVLLVSFTFWLYFMMGNLVLRLIKRIFYA